MLLHLLLRKEISAILLIANPVIVNCDCPYLSANLPLKGPTLKRQFQKAEFLNPLAGDLGSPQAEIASLTKEELLSK